jgi:hypothetical protein
MRRGAPIRASTLQCCSAATRACGFCSHLAMRGAPARAIQELAGHEDLTTTQRYMHLSPAAIEGAIRLLEQSPHPAKTARGFQSHFNKLPKQTPTRVHVD